MTNVPWAVAFAFVLCAIFLDVKSRVRDGKNKHHCGSPVEEIASKE